jgi:hypothetical protein
MKYRIVALCGLLVVCALGAAQLKLGSLTVEQVMTPEEIKSTGVATLSAAQRKELDLWLNRYTLRMLSETKTRGECNPSIETQIDGEFKGWEGETIYKLRNGQIWQQATYHYHYHYAYAPEVVIYSSSDGCSMKVEDDDDEAVHVRRLK